MENIQNMKKCSKCKEEKPIEDYIKHGMRRSSKCDPCRLEYQQQVNRKRAKLEKMNLW